MGAHVSDVRTYRFSSQNELFLDANIWLFVFGPLRPGDTRAKTYSRVFKNILAEKCRIYIDVLVLSEFVNTYSRLKWRTASKPSESFKRFRTGPRFAPLARDIAGDVKSLLRHCERIDNGFDVLEIDTLMGEYAAGNSDFNDQVISSLCLKRGLKLVTDDADFSDQEISVLTANNRLLKQ